MKQEKETKKKITEDITELNNKLKEKDEEILKSKADLINYRKRKDEEVNNLLKYASFDIFQDLLPVLDNFERAISFDSEKITPELNNFLDGFKMIYMGLKEIVSKYGVKEINCLGKKYDPNLESSVFMESDSKYEEDIVLEVLQKGYTYNDKLLRSASVKINKIKNNNKEMEGNDKNE